MARTSLTGIRPLILPSGSRPPQAPSSPSAPSPTTYRREPQSAGHLAPLTEHRRPSQTFAAAAASTLSKLDSAARAAQETAKQVFEAGNAARNLAKEALRHPLTTARGILDLGEQLAQDLDKNKRIPRKSDLLSKKQANDAAIAMTIRNHPDYRKSPQIGERIIKELCKLKNPKMDSSKWFHKFREGNKGRSSAYFFSGIERNLFDALK